jgi:cobalt-zinc-cadmium efflux system outer membrane protein
VPSLYEADLIAPLADGAGRREMPPQSVLERLPLAGPERQATPDRAVPKATLGDAGNDLFEPEGPPNGLSLDAAIERLVHTNRELLTKQYEIPQAEADIVTGGLRSNPLLFYSTANVPYGSYSRQRPGEVNTGVSVVYPVDYSGKRKARVAVADQEKRVLVAQYQDAVRREIDHLTSDYVDVLAARRDVRSAEHSLAMAEELLRAAHDRAAGDEQIDDLIMSATLRSFRWTTPGGDIIRQRSVWRRGWSFRPARPSGWSCAAPCASPRRRRRRLTNW